VPQNRNVLKDQLIWFPSQVKAGEEPCLFRRVEIWDEDKQESIAFLTSLLQLGATTIAAIYKGPLAGGAVLQGAQAET